MGSYRFTIVSIALVSSAVNILSLTAPLFMLQVYDRVISSGSVSTLVVLVILVGGLLAFQAILDVLRSRVLLRIGEHLDYQLSGKVFKAITRLPLRSQTRGDGLLPLRDLDNLRSFLSTQGPTAFFDLPWLPVYIAICFIFHFWLGITALVGALVLIVVAALTGWMSWKPTMNVTAHGMARNKLLVSTRRNAEVIRAMGFEDRLEGIWQRSNSEFLTAQRQVGDVAGGMGGMSRSLRIMLQTGILAVGAYLVIRQEVSPGVMIAASIMMGRALAPVDLAIASWKPLLASRQSWSRLNDTLAFLSKDERLPMRLPKPERQLSAEGVVVAAPGTDVVVVNGISFSVPSGSALGIIGPSGSGKTSLARAIVGVWTPARGKLRLDGAALDQWDFDALGHHLGYLPQDVELFEGTIAQNIARFDPAPDPEMVVSAAQSANVHDLVLKFPEGYETQIGDNGSALSAGQRQRIGLARALYGEPFLVVLDEPNSHLDAEGEAALVEAIASVRARQGIVVIIAHRPSTLQTADLVLMMDKGMARDFGPKNEVFARVLKKSPTQKQEPSQSASFQQDIYTNITSHSSASGAPKRQTENVVP